MSKKITNLHSQLRNEGDLEGEKKIPKKHINLESKVNGLLLSKSS